MSVERVPGKGNRVLFLNQRRYIEDVRKKYGYDNKFRKVHRPSMPGKVTNKDCFEGNPDDNEKGGWYREVCGTLRWIEQCTRPDISTALSELCKVQINPGPEHVKRLDHLLRYVLATAHLGLMYGGPKHLGAYGILVGHVDSDWAGDPDNKYSRGGWLMCAWQTPISWASCKMKAVAASSCESEYMAASEIVRECLWLRYLFSDLGYGDLSTKQFGTLCQEDFAKVQLSELVDKNERTWRQKPILCFGDNKGANALTENPVLHKRTKHIHIRYNMSKHEVKKGHVVFGYINTADNIADMLTKGLARQAHEHLVGKIMCGVKDGKPVTVQGDELRWELPKQEELTDLYRTKPLGIYPPWNNNKTPWIHQRSHWADEMPNPTGGAAVTHDEPLGHLAIALDWAMQNVRTKADQELLDSTACACVFTLVVSGHIALGAIAAKKLVAMSSFYDTLCDIVDSGASFTFVSGKTKLTNGRPTEGYVHVADGRKQKIEEIGDYGSLRNARRVASFQRTLVSVSDLVEQYGRVLFDGEGVHVCTPAEAAKNGYIKTKIGEPTQQRLFSFDSKQLKRHVRRVARCR